jgi:hypothetical protein
VTKELFIASTTVDIPKGPDISPRWCGRIPGVWDVERHFVMEFWEVESNGESSW